MRNIVLYIATSLDGYIARKNGALDWLPQPAEGDFGYGDFYKTIDTVVMGRTTYEQVISELSVGVWVYEGKACYVATTKDIKSSKDVTFVSKDVTSFINDLKKQPGKDIWLVGGSKLIETFVQKNLIDKYIVTVIPTILGKGIPLFRGVHDDLELKLVGTKTYGDVVELRYTKIKYI